MSFISLYGQNSSVEVEAAYQLAEKEFKAGRFENSVRFLDEVIEKPGGRNAKTLFLKIMSYKKLNSKGPELISLMKKAIEAFEKAPDIAAFDQSKRLEVMKLKLSLKKEMQTEAVPQPGEGDELANFKIDGLKTGVTIEEAREADPAFFSTAQNRGDSLFNVMEFEGNPRISRIILFRNGKLYSHMKSFHFTQEDSTYSNGRKLVERFTRSFRSAPFVLNIPQRKTASGYLQGIVYRWLNENNSVQLRFDSGTSLEKFTSFVILSAVNERIEEFILK